MAQHLAGRLRTGTKESARHAKCCDGGVVEFTARPAYTGKRANTVGTDGVLVSPLVFKTKWAAWCVAGRFDSDTFPPSLVGQGFLGCAKGLIGGHKMASTSAVVTKWSRK